MIRFTSCHRYSPFWTKPANGTTEAEVQPETLWLLAQTDAGRCTMVVPLLDSTTRYSLRGTAAGLALVAETGDPAVVSDGGVALFVSSGDDPYALAAAGGARAVHRHLGTGGLRTDKPVPDFLDLFGWCNWDAFYKEVSADKVLAGLDAFARGGVQPPLLILDDGWQTWRRSATGEERLTSLAPKRALRW
jgi:raffinose synthase